MNEHPPSMGPGGVFAKFYTIFSFICIMGIMGLDCASSWKPHRHV